MLYSFLTCLFLTFVLFHTSSTSTTTTPSPITAAFHDPAITNFLVFSSNQETVITFEPKLGWLLNEERKFRLYLTGINLHNNSIVFASADDCSADDYITAPYRLSSAPVNVIDVKLPGITKSHATVYVCLLTSLNASPSSLNNTIWQNATKLDGPYFTFVRERGRLPFAAKICLILMLFIISGFYR